MSASVRRPDPAHQADGRRPRLGRRFFDDLYANSVDPWGFADSDYERDKYDHSLQALGDSRFERGLEVGCSIGVFSQRLATVCDHLTAIDVSPLAVARADRRLADQPGVTLAAMTFPEQMPDGPWDLLVCAEVLYYLDAAGLDLALERLRAALADDAVVLAVHWRPATTRYPFTGDEIHDRLTAELEPWHALDDRRPRYRLDLFRGR
jgi:predicted TPR repeat methyltransferase